MTIVPKARQAMVVQELELVLELVLDLVLELELVGDTATLDPGRCMLELELVPLVLETPGWKVNRR